MTARQHHFVPQCYLKGFASDPAKPKLFVVDLKQARFFETSPANVAKERDFHRVNIDGHAPDALENAFSHFESSLAVALERIIAARDIKTEDDRSHLLNLLSLLAVKNPRLRERMRAAQERMHRMIGDLVTANEQIWQAQTRRMAESGALDPSNQATREQVREFLQRGEFTVEVPTERHLSIELDIQDSILQRLAAREWTLCRAPVDSPGFLTSDHPVCLTWSDPELADGPFPPGFGVRKTDVLFPIARHLVWIGTFEGRTGTVDMPEEAVRTFNTMICFHADRQIYGNSAAVSVGFDDIRTLGQLANQLVANQLATNVIGDLPDRTERVG